MSSQERRFEGFNREERIGIMCALNTQYRLEIEATQRSNSLGVAHSEHQSEILSVLLKELNEVGFWPKEQA